MTAPPGPSSEHASREAGNEKDGSDERGEGCELEENEESSDHGSLLTAAPAQRRSVV